MRHAVLGVGGVGGLLGAALARSGSDVTLLMRRQSLLEYSGRLTLESRVLGDFEVQVPAVAMLDRDVDVLWVATKATVLSEALALATPERVAAATVIPLMNGIDHVAALRGRFSSVVAGAMRVESQRLPDGRISQSSPFIRMDLAGAEDVVAEVAKTGIDCRVDGDEVSLLWGKLVFLAPFALATTAFRGSMGRVRSVALYRQAQHEAVAVATACGAMIDMESLEALRSASPDSMRSSMQRDVEQGRAPELDAIAGPILRGGRSQGIDVSATQTLVDQVQGLVAAAHDERPGGLS